MREKGARRSLVGGGGRGAVARASVIVAFILSLESTVPGADAYEPKLMGAKLTWAVHPNFRPEKSTDDVNAVTRHVTFKLSTAWKLDWLGQFGDCQRKTGDAVIDPDTTWNTRCGSEERAFGNLTIYSCNDINNPCAQVKSRLSVRNNFRVLQTQSFGQRSLQHNFYTGSQTVTIMSGEFTHTVTVPDERVWLLAYLEIEDADIDLTEVSNLIHQPPSGFYGSVLNNFGEDLVKIVPTSVKLCAKSDCRPRLEGSHVKNYFSPDPMFPLVLFAPPDATTQRGTRFKVNDYDGQRLLLKDIRGADWLNDADDTSDVGTYVLTQTMDLEASNSTGALLTPTSLAEDPSTLGFRMIEVQDFDFEELERQVTLVGGNVLAPGMLKYDDLTAYVTNLRERREEPKSTGGDASVQMLFTVIPQDSGCPSNTGLGWGDGLVTEVDCMYDEPDTCTTMLRAKATRSSTGRIGVRTAPGFAKLPSCPILAEDGSTLDPAGPWCQANYLTAPCGCCQNYGLDFTCKYTHPGLSVDKVGLSETMCFVARSTDENTFDSAGLGVCHSEPHCVRFNIKGHVPRFVDPTPLEENSYDLEGVLVPGQTDVGACLGYPLYLQLKATDDDSGDLVRIFIDDANQEQHTNSFNFFDDENDQPSRVLSECGTYTPYQGKRVGRSGTAQKAIKHLMAANNDSSIMAALDNALVFENGESVLSVEYFLNESGTDNVGNGIWSRRVCDGSYNCRERLLNMDKVLCGYAYDNSRVRYSRWVGHRYDQNDHSFGSYASPRHCWRIRLQAPPYFITNNTGCGPMNGSDPNNLAFECTPYPSEPGTIVDSSGNPLAYRPINVNVGATLSLTIMAKDPNPKDTVTILILEDPGTPPGMVVGRSTCRPVREATQECTEGSPCVCSSNERLNEFTEQDTPCNNVTMTLTWTPDASSSGQEFLVCFIARDSSTLCQGKGPEKATLRGWYGEQQCVKIGVAEPRFTWVGDWVDEYALQPVQVYVGCTLRFTAHVKESSDGISYGVRVLYGNDYTADANIDIDIYTQPEQSTFSVSPKLGSEGTVKMLCIAGGDALGITKLGGICLEDGRKGCRHDHDCGLGVCSPVCVELRVQKCRYCIKDGETLDTVLGHYKIETNWMRLWTLNADTYAALGTACSSSMDCDPANNQVAVDNPELILKGSDGVGRRILWTGVPYRPQEDEGIEAIACHFRTNIHSIAAANPEMYISPTTVVPRGYEMCMMACNARRDLDSHGIPKCTGAMV